MDNEENIRSSQVNLATVVMLLTLLIPIGYLFWVNVLKEDATAVGWDYEKHQPVYPDNSGTGNSTAASHKGNASKETENKQSFSAQGLSLYRQGRYKEAVEAYKKALSYDENDAVNWNNLAAAYGSLGMYAEEIEACHRALAIDPNFQLAKNNLAWAQSQLKQ